MTRLEPDEGAARRAPAPSISEATSDSPAASQASLSERVAVNAPLLALSRLVSALTGLLALAISARYLGTDRFGTLTAATLYVSLVAIFADVGLYVIVAREIIRSPKSQREIASNALTLGLTASVLVVTVGLTVSQFAYPGAGNVPIREAVAILLLTVVASPPVGAINAQLVAQERTWLTQAIPAAGSIVALLGLVVVALSELGFKAVVASYVVGAVVNVAVAFRAVGPRRVRPRLAFDFKVWKRLIRLAVPQAAIIILTVLYLRADGVLLSLLRSQREVGVYGVAFKVVEVLQVIAAQLMLTLFPAIARLEPDSARLRTIMQKALSGVQVIVPPIFVLGLVFAPIITGILGGSGFQGSATVLRIGMLTVALSFFNALFANALVALGQQKRLLGYSLAVAIFNIVLNLVLIPVWGIYGAAIALDLTEAVALVGLMFLYRKLSRLPRPERMAPVLLAMTVMVLLAATGRLVGEATSADLPAALAGGVLALSAYTGLLVAARAMPDELMRGLKAVASRFSRA